MAKVNTQRLKRPERKVSTLTFTDPAQPEVKVTLTLKAPDLPTLAFAATQGEAYAADWVAGEEPYILRDGSNEMVPLTEGLCSTLATLEALQWPDNPEDLYDVHDLIGLMLAMPKAWVDINTWAEGIINTSPAIGAKPAGN